MSAKLLCMADAHLQLNWVGCLMWLVLLGRNSSLGAWVTSRGNSIAAGLASGGR